MSPAADTLHGSQIASTVSKQFQTRDLQGWGKQPSRVLAMFYCAQLFYKELCIAVRSFCNAKQPQMYSTILNQLEFSRVNS